MIESLDNIPNSNTVKVLYVDAQGKFLRRLSDLGLNKNSTVTPMFRSPDNNLTAYLVKGSLIALRNETAKNIKVIYN